MSWIVVIFSLIKQIKVIGTQTSACISDVWKLTPHWNQGSRRELNASGSELGCCTAVSFCQGPQTWTFYLQTVAVRRWRWRGRTRAALNPTEPRNLSFWRGTQERWNRSLPDIIEGEREGRWYARLKERGQRWPGDVSDGRLSGLILLMQHSSLTVQGHRVTNPGLILVTDNPEYFGLLLNPSPSGASQLW